MSSIALPAVNHYVRPEISVSSNYNANESRDQVAWYVVPIAILLGFALILALAVSLYCIYKGKSLYSWWRLGNNGYVKIGCK